MKITLATRVPVEATMIFEAVYEDALALDLEEKKELERSGWRALWLFVDGVLAGETYGVHLGGLREEVEDCDAEPRDAIYCYSTTILPEFQGKGLSKILKAAWLGLCLRDGDVEIVGHATSDRARRLNEFFGARVVKEHEGWYGTDRKASFYRLSLR